jgi:hypothetical protein
MAQFLSRRGHRVFESNGILWGWYRGPFMCSLPYHKRIDAGSGEIGEMLRRHGVSCVRFPSARGRGMQSGLYVCRPREYSMKSLLPRFRTHVNRGLEACEIRPVEPEELLRDGLELNLDTMRRQRRHEREFGDPAAWRRFVEAVRHSPGISVTGAFVGGRLSAYVLTCKEEGRLQILHKMSRASERHLSVGHALDYRVISDAANDPSIELVENSFVSLVPNDGLDSYKRHMGFTIEPYHLEIHFHPRIAPLVTSKFAVSAARAAWRRHPDNSNLELTAKVLEGARTTMTSELPVLNNPGLHTDPCQHTGCFGYSRTWRPPKVVWLRGVLSFLKKEGLRSTAVKAVHFLQRRNSPAAVVKSAPRPLAAADVLGLQSGDWVEVKTEAEIRATLDEQEKNRGLAFVPHEMLVHCGRRFQVKRRVEKIFLEESRQNRKLKNTVLLENVQCQGIGLDCDRSCYLFWREAWLKKVDSPNAEERR